ncbi:hypothetical protein ANDA3_1482 [plant metagenome]|uniref:Uncharacterized protein n=2 Tax=root TaxID=1 RepID=A0A1C3K3Q4_9BURK|nr:hypothetical protein ODI_00769 [Orrella dioscoreae]SOE48371.1 hypothetical protein ODI_R1399 [Orrella dioscoreae]
MQKRALHLVELIQHGCFLGLAGPRLSGRASGARRAWR